MKAYKILRNIGGVLYSCNPHLPKDMWVRYFETRPTASHLPKTPIYVFETEADARQFLNKQFDNSDAWKRDTFELWEVETIGRVKQRPPIIRLSYVTMEGEDTFLKWAEMLVTPKRKTVDYQSAPVGSLGAPKVRLIRRIDMWHARLTL
jgi:hypothetical protein